MTTRTNALLSQQQTGKITASIIPLRPVVTRCAMDIKHKPVCSFRKIRLTSQFWVRVIRFKSRGHYPN